VDPRGTTRATFNDEALTSRLTAVLRRTLGDENVVPFQREMGSEDFSEYGHAGVPAVLFWIGATEPQKFAEAKAKGVSPPFQHSPNFAPDRERTIRTATATLTISALELLGRPSSRPLDLLRRPADPPRDVAPDRALHLAVELRLRPCQTGDRRPQCLHSHPDRGICTPPWRGPAIRVAGRGRRRVRSSVAEILELEGFAVDTAVHGQQALDKLRSGASPNVMLLDLMMPVMNGLELLQHLRAEAELRPPPVIVLSANRGYEAEDLGVAAVVRKPFDVDALVDNIATVLRKAGQAPPVPPRAGI